MKAHAVRHLRHCTTCDRLVHRDDMLTDESRCVRCAWRASGAILDEFCLRYPVEDWQRLTLGLIGAENMQKLLTFPSVIRAARGEGRS